MAKKLNTTPAGIAVFPHLDAPDTKYDAAGVYTSKLRFDLDKVQDLLLFLQTEMDLSLEEAQVKWNEAVADEKDARKKRKLKAKPPEAADAPWDIDEEDGTVEVNFKMKASGKSRKDGKPWTRRPKLFDAQLAVVPFGVKVGGGSILKVGYNVSRFFTALVGAGIALQLEAVQIIELQKFGGVTAEEAGFEAADGGFSAADLTAEDTDVEASPEDPQAGEPEDPPDAGAKDADKDADISDF